MLVARILARILALLRHRPTRLSRGLWPCFSSACLAACLVGSACLSAAQSRQDSLVRIAHEYNDGLRWGRPAQVTPHLPPNTINDFKSRLANMADDFQMADYEVTSIQFTGGGWQAAVTVDFAWYNQTRSLLRHTVVAQDWAFRAGQWLCVKQIRTRGDRFPLIPEPTHFGDSAAAALGPRPAPLH